MSKFKVITVVGTRPEIIRLSSLIRKLDDFCDHRLVHTGQNQDYTLNQVFFDDLDLREPDFFLELSGLSLGAFMGGVLEKMEKIFLEESPDALMVLGDTNSSISALLAERLHIPTYHMEAGNRSFDANVPEELNRRMVDQISTFNLPYNSHSKANLLREGKHPRFMTVTGSPLAEVIQNHRHKFQDSDILERLGLQREGYILVSLHRQENVDIPSRLKLAIKCLTRLSEDFNKTIIVSTHPRTRVRLQDSGLEDVENVRFHEPFGYVDYNRLQMESFCVVSDSGTISEESALLGFPAVTIRDSFERPEALEVGSILLTGLDPSSISNKVELARRLSPPDDMPEGYEVLNFSDRVLAFLFSTVGLQKSWLGIHKKSQ